MPPTHADNHPGSAPRTGRRLRVAALMLLAVAGLAWPLVFAGRTANTYDPTPADIEAVTGDDDEATRLAVDLPGPVPSEETVAAMPRAEQIELRRGPSRERPLEVACFDPVTVAPPAADLAAVVAASEPGTCFRLAAGTYTFHNVQPKDHMTFLGAGRDQVVVQGSDETENAFSGTASGVTIGRMTLAGFQGAAGEKPQEQGAIRGTAGIWKSDAGQMATEWLIDDVAAIDNVATGIFLGDHFTVRNSLFSGNGVTGLGSSEIVGGFITDNVVTDNGFDGAEESELANSAGMKFVESGTLDQPLVVIRNEVSGNHRVGIWCDIACEGFVVVDNYVHDYDRVGVMVEISRNAVISNNLITQAAQPDRDDWEVGLSAILIAESANVTVEGNHIDGAFRGVGVKQSRRPAESERYVLDNYDDVNYVLANVEVRDNIVRNTRTAGVEVRSNAEGIANLRSVAFSGNRYDDPSAMRFWWDGDHRLDWDDWTGGGFDTGGLNAGGSDADADSGGRLPAPPPWPPSTAPPGDGNGETSD